MFKCAEHQRRRQQHRAGGQVVPAVRGAAQRVRREVGDQRLLGAFGGGQEHAVAGEQRPQQRRVEAVDAEQQIEQPVQHPAEHDQSHASDAVGQSRQRRRQQRGNSRGQRPQQRDLVGAQAELARSQQQEHVRRVAEGEQRQHQQVAAQWWRQRTQPPRERHRARRRARRLWLTQAQRERDGQSARQQRPQEHFAQRHAVGEQPGRGERADHGPGVVHRAVQAERQTALLRRDRAGEQRVARRTAQPLAGAVGETQQQHHRPAAGDVEQRPADRRQRVAADDPAARVAEAVGEHAAGQFQQACARFGDAFDQPERARAGEQHRGDEQRHQRIDELAGAVVAQADQPEQPDRARQREQRFKHRRNQRVAEGQGAWYGRRSAVSRTRRCRTGRPNFRCRHACAAKAGARVRTAR
ncbi:hypothetical protein GALL_433350 [mine drainage metagenome]|uniref:Uncharacterized protein n=1 Tax=mine drainage metagenome TaxID=410659 RepID=A0A1J5Q522_9ZZZZ